MEKQLAFFAGTRSPETQTAKLTKPSAPIQRKLSGNRRQKNENDNEGGAKGAKGNWKKVFAFSKFMSLAKSQTNDSPAQLIIAGRHAKNLNSNF